MLLTNELPRLSDTSGALAKRFIVLTLEQSFYGRENIMLTDSLIEELPGILNWAREGYRRLRQRGHFIQPASARETIEQLEILASPVTAFIRERCTIGPGLTAPTELLYQSWRTWCEANGRDKPGTAQTFGRDLKAAFPAIKTAQNRDGEDRYRVYQGVGLK